MKHQGVHGNALTERPHVMHELVPLLIIAAFSLIAYSNTFDVPFQFDDLTNIELNPLIQNTQYLFSPSEYCAQVPPQNVRLDTCYFFTRRYIGYLSFAGNFLVHGLNVRGYHIVNLGIHILNGVLVYSLVMLAFRTPFVKSSPGGASARPVAFLTALLFATHPIQTQAVTYIVQRFTSLATLFYLLSLVSYIKARLSESSRKRYMFYALSLIAAVAAMKTKEIAFTCPLMIAVFEFSFFHAKMKTRLPFLLPVLLTMLVIPLSMVSMGQPLDRTLTEFDVASRVSTAMSRRDYFFTELPVIVTYMRLIFFPVGQNLDYDYPVYHSFFQPTVFMSFLLLSTILGLAAYLFSKSHVTHRVLRLSAFGIIWFFLAFSVESSFIPIVDVIFEHRVYLPSVGAFLAIASSLVLLAGKLQSRWEPSGKALLAACGVIIIVLTAVTLKRNMVWQDEVSLWEDVVRKSPAKARGYNDLGFGYMKRGQLENAIIFYKEAVERDPNYLQAHSDLGNIYLKLGQFEKAVESFTRSIGIDPRYADIYNNRGNAYKGLNQFEKAIDDYSEAIACYPMDADYYFNRGLTRVKMKEYDKAIADFSQAISLNPGHSGAFLQRGMATYIISRDTARALPDLQRACELGNRIGCEVLRSGPAPGREP